MSSPSHSRMDSVRICSSSSLRFRTSWHCACRKGDEQALNDLTWIHSISDPSQGTRRAQLTDRFLKDAMHFWMSGRSGWVSCTETKGDVLVIKAGSSSRDGSAQRFGYTPPCASPALWVRWGICRVSWRVYWGLWSGWGSQDWLHPSPP